MTLFSKVLNFNESAMYLILKTTLLLVRLKCSTSINSQVVFVFYIQLRRLRMQKSMFTVPFFHFYCICIQIHAVLNIETIVMKIE